MVDLVERVERVDAPRVGDRDQAVELPEVLDRKRDPLLVGEAPEDVGGDRRAEVGVQLGEAVLEHVPSLGMDDDQRAERHDARQVAQVVCAGVQAAGADRARGGAAVDRDPVAAGPAGRKVRLVGGEREDAAAVDG